MSCWPGSPGGGEICTERLFALLGPRPALATELQSPGTYVRFSRIGAILWNWEGLPSDQRGKTCFALYVRVRVQIVLGVPNGDL